MCVCTPTTGRGGHKPASTTWWSLASPIRVVDERQLSGALPGNGVYPRPAVGTAARRQFQRSRRSRRRQPGGVGVSPRSPTAGKRSYLQNDASGRLRWTPAAGARRSPMRRGCRRADQTNPGADRRRWSPCAISTAGSGLRPTHLRRCTCKTFPISLSHQWRHPPLAILYLAVPPHRSQTSWSGSTVAESYAGAAVSVTRVAQRPHGARVARRRACPVRVRALDGRRRPAALPEILRTATMVGFTRATDLALDGALLQEHFDVSAPLGHRADPTRPRWESSRLAFQRWIGALAIDWLVQCRRGKRP